MVLKLLICLLLLLPALQASNITYDGIYYEYFEAEVNYKNASAECKKVKMTLAFIPNTNVQSIVMNLTVGSSSKGFFIGLKYIPNNIFMWENNNRSLPNMNWSMRIDLKESESEYCVFLQNDGFANIGSCSRTLPYICANSTAEKYQSKALRKPACPNEYFQFRNKCYKMNLNCNDSVYNKNEAEAKCKKDGARLVVVNSFVENEFITALMTISPYPVWTDLVLANVTNSMFVWVKNSSQTFPTYPINFKKGEPNMHNEEKCLMIYHRLGNIGEINDEQCGKELNFICETKLVEGNSNNISTPNPLFVQGECKNGFFQFNGACYSVDLKAENYKDASSQCSILNIHNKLDIAFVRSLMNFKNISSAWLDINANKDGIIYLNSTEGIIPKINDSFCYVLTSNQKGLQSSLCSNKSGGIATICNYFLDQNKDSDNLECPYNWTKVGEKCYRAFPELNTFIEAATKCSLYNSKLATFSNMREAQAVNFFLQNTDFWIGIDLDLYRKQTWIDGSKLDYCLFRHTTNFKKESQNRNCFVFHSSKIEWNDKNCKQLNFFICEQAAVKNLQKDVFPYNINGDFFGIFSKSLNWMEANKFCKTKGGRNAFLASFHSLQQEMDFFAHVKVIKPLWIGLQLIYGNKKWVDGSLANYIRRYLSNDEISKFSCFTSQKVLDPLSEDSFSVRWSNDNCGMSLPFICKISKKDKTEISTIYNESISPHCPSNFRKYKKACFKVFDNHTEWDDADLSCKTQHKNARLARFDTYGEFEFALSLVRDVKYSQIWIGLYQDKSFQFLWSDEHPVKFKRMVMPNIESSHESTKVAVDISENPFSNGIWRFYPDLSKAPYICRIDTNDPSDPYSTNCRSKFSRKYSNFCYHFSSISLKYNEAVKYCKELQSELLIIDDTFEESFIKSYMYEFNVKTIWLGVRLLSNNTLNVWKSVNNSDVYYTNWRKLSHFGNDQHIDTGNPQYTFHGCFVLDSYQSGIVFSEIQNGFFVMNCEVLLQYICKAPAAERRAKPSKLPTCTNSSKGISYLLDVTKTKDNAECIRWDVVMKSESELNLKYHKSTQLVSSYPFNKNGYVSFSLNRCSEIQYASNASAYSCYIFINKQFVLKECQMVPCEFTFHNETIINQSSNRGYVIFFLIFLLLLSCISLLFIFRRRILSNYRVRSVLAFALGRYQPEWMVNSRYRTASSAPPGVVGFANPVYTPLETKY